jgi:hypothetical protein
MKIEGCVHVHVDQNGKVGNVFVYLSQLPQEQGVVHLTMDGGEFMTVEQLLSTHAQYPQSREEFDVPPTQKVYHRAPGEPE